MVPGWTAKELFGSQHPRTVKNYPPCPRRGGQERGYVNSRYFYGALHLAVLPGEMPMDGSSAAVLPDQRPAWI
jgi:hypothetical protein